MPNPSWTTDDPTEPGVYWVVLHTHDSDDAKHDIFDMANGFRMDPRPLPCVAEVCPDDDDPDGLVPFFIGMEDYPFRDLWIDFREVWWYGPLELPPSPPGHLPMRPLGEGGLRPFSVPSGWPPTPPNADGA